MKFGTALLGIAALAGVGYFVGKRIIEKKGIEIPAEAARVKHDGSRLRNASMFAVGAIRTGADKVAEGFRDITTKDMVKRGEATFEQAKETTESIKKDIDNLKNMVTSINTDSTSDPFSGEDDEESDEDDPDNLRSSDIVEEGEPAEETSEEAVEDIAEKVTEEATEEVAEDVAEEVAEEETEDVAEEVAEEETEDAIEEESKDTETTQEVAPSTPDFPDFGEPEEEGDDEEESESDAEPLDIFAQTFGYQAPKKTELRADLDDDLKDLMSNDF